MKKLLISLAILALAVFAVAVTQTGNIIVSVMSEEGQILPGATVTVTSPVLMGARVQTTAANGKATFRNLPPGDYTVEVVMDGFQTARQGGIEIRIQKTSKILVYVKLGQAREVIEVVGTGPLVDTTSNTVAAEFDFDNYINHMPTYRHYGTIMSLAGGVALGGGNPSAAGGGVYSNLYMIDGTMSMDPRTHTWGNQFNVDTIADVNLLKGGISAEYGHMGGAVLNMVTKSGSNDVTGIGRVELWRINWNDLSENNPERTSDNRRVGMEGQVWNISGGGPLYPDMLWWYLSYSKYERTTGYTRFLDPMHPTTSTAANRTYFGHFFSVKGTVQLGEDIKANVFYREDPIYIYNAQSAYYTGAYTMPEADGVQRQGGENLMASTSFILSESAFVEVAYSRDRGDLAVVNHAEDDPGGLWTKSKSTGPTYISDDSWYWGAGSLDYHSKRYMDTVRGSLNYLLQSDSLGEHDIKLGVEYLDNAAGIIYNYYTGNEVIFTSPASNVGFDNVQWTMRKTIDLPRLAERTCHDYYWTAYLQDSVQASDELTLNIGVRTDIGLIYDNLENEIFSDGIFTALAPRVGIAYDLSGSAIRASFGRYYDVYTMYLNDDFATDPNPEHWHLWEPADGVDGRNGWIETSDWWLGLAESPNAVDPEITPQYMDEATLGFDWMISDTMALGISGIYRDYKDAITKEDLDGDRYGYWTNLETDAHGTSSKVYWGAVLDFRKRPTEDNLFLNINLTYQNLEGFGENLLTNYYHAHPYQTEEHIANYWGDVGQFNWIGKGQVTYFFPNNWYIGLQAFYQQGAAFSTTQTVTIPGYGRVTYYPNGRADMERLPGRFWIDLQFGIEQTVELPFDVPFWDDTLLLGIYVDIFNILNDQCASNKGTNIASPSTYNILSTWNAARNYELGFRIEF